MKNNIITQSIPGGFSVIASSFIAQSLEHMIPWLIVTFSVVVCDLMFGIRKCLLLGEEFRFSSAVRRTMGKMVTYFAFVCMVVMINIASGNKWNIDVYSCLFVCFIEFCSIISNILKPKGYNFNLLKALGLFGKKVLDVKKEVMSESDYRSDCYRYHRGSYALHALHTVLGEPDYCCIIRCRCCCRMGGSCGL